MEETLLSSSSKWEDGYQPSKRPFLALWRDQLVALVKKNIQILAYKWKVSLAMVILPSLFVAGLYYLTHSLSGLDSSPQPVRLTRCTAFDITSQPYAPLTPCITLAFAPNSSAEAGDVRDIMARVAAATGLGLGTDFMEFSDKAAMAGWAFDHASTQMDAAVVVSMLPGGQATYELWYNSSLPALYSTNGLDPTWRYTGYSGRLLAVQKEMDAGIIAHTLATLGAQGRGEEAPAALKEHRTLRVLGQGEGSSSSSSSSHAPPIPPLLAGTFTLDATISPFEEVDILSGGVSDPSSLAVYQFGGSFLIMGVVAGALLILTTVSGEKHRKLLGSLKTIGLLDSTYWISWLASYLPILLAMALLTPAVAWTANIILFKRVQYGLHVLALWLLGTSTAAMSLACAAFLGKPSSVSCTAFCHFAAALSLSIVYNVFGLNRIVYRPDFPPALSYICLIPWPFFHYGRLVGTMMLYILSGGGTLNGSGGSASFITAQSSTVPSFGWKELEKTPPSETIYINGLPQTWADKPAAFDLSMLAILTFVYLALAMYFGSVSGGSPLYFCLLPSYWGLGGPPPSPEAGDTLAAVQRASAQEGSIRVHKLSKSYKQLQALKEVSLTLHPSALTALLGQNGAGKSTLIGLLSGLTEPTHGAMYAMGRDISKEMGTLRDVMGSCPQDDLLWEELSPEQHLALFGAFKGLAGAGLKAHVMDRLGLVGLAKEAGNAVATFSGGMKRRLSVALAAIGAPRIMFFDEPTTGLDPLSRRAVWDIIEALKPGRILLLTTHSMEEADSLADEVALLAGGKLRAVGTPLFLKSSFGSGYSINIIANPARLGAVKAVIQAHLPEATIVGDFNAQSSTSAGTMMGGGLMYPPPPSANGGSLNTSTSQPLLPYGRSQTPLPPALTTIPSDQMKNSTNSGSLTVSVPYSALHLIPPFLRLLSDMAEGGGGGGGGEGGGDDSRTIREWGISLSSLEEVFLKLASREREVNSGANPGDGGNSQDPHQQRQQQQQRTRMCALCEAAPTVPVSVFNAKGVEVSVTDLLCMECATTRDGKDVEAVKATLVAQRAALVAGMKGDGFQLLAPAATAAAAAATASAGAEGESATAASKAMALPGAVEGEGEEEFAPLPPLPKPLWDAPERGAFLPPPSKQSGPLPPVHFFSQFLSVLILQTRISSPAKFDAKGVCCSRMCVSVVLVLIAVILTVATSGLSTPPITLHQCSTGFWSDNSTGASLCDRDSYIDFITGALKRSEAKIDTPWTTPASKKPSTSAQHSPLSSQVPHLLTKLGMGSFFPISSTPLLEDQLSSSSLRLYKTYCSIQGDLDKDFLCPGGTIVQAPDFVSLSTGFVTNIYRVQNPRPVIAYTDATASAEAGFVPFSTFDLLEGFENVAVANNNFPSVCADGGLTCPLITPLNLGLNTPIKAATTGDVNAWLKSVQNKVKSGLAPINASCYANGQTKNDDFAYSVPNALDFANTSFPASGLAFRRLTASTTSPGLAYDMRIPALKSDSQSAPYRGNNYYFLAAATPLCNYVTYNWDNNPQLDDPFTDGGNPGLSAYITANMVHGGYLRAAMGAQGSPVASSAFIHTAVTQMPPVEWIPGAGFAPPSPYQTLIWPLFTMTTLPGIVAAVAMEKEEKLWAMMAMSGMRRGPYICAHWASGVLSYLPVGFAYVLVGMLAGSASFTLPSPTLLFSLVVVWAVAQAGWGVLLGSVITAPRVGSIIMYMLAVIVALTNLIVTSTVTPFPAYFVQIPFLSYARASTLVLSASGLPTGTRGGKIWEALGITLGHGLAALALGAYIHAVLPGPEQTGVPLHPLFPYYALRDYLYPGAAATKSHAALATSSSGDAEEEGEGGGNVDADVAREAGKAEDADSSLKLHDASSQSTTNPYAILIHTLRKYYTPSAPTALWHALWHGGKRPPVKRAVAGVSLCIPYGETLGLLGPNGAGKTTIISVLTGAASATAGGASIGGMDVATELASVWRRLGVCPQFDCVWGQLSVRCHLEFYARVKGIESGRMRGCVQQAAEKVGLDGDSFDMPAGKLSGGQRRRLSIAIALLGDPDVVFLDEPTTGLDPENRNGIHRILAGEKRAGRAVLLTTHSMDEADVLCDRIAIVSGGKLRAVGSQQRLKHRFGSGYRLTLHLNPPTPAALEATAAKAHAFVMRSLSSKAGLLSRVGNTLSYVLPREIDVAGVFAKMDAVRRNKSEGVQEFGVQQASLEEVFIRVVRSAGGLEGTGTTLANTTVLKVSN